MVETRLYADAIITLVSQKVFLIVYYMAKERLGIASMHNVMVFLPNKKHDKNKIRGHVTEDCVITHVILKHVILATKNADWYGLYGTCKSVQKKEKSAGISTFSHTFLRFL